LPGNEDVEEIAGSTCMNEKYLWNRSGEADEEIARLERLLAPMRYREPRIIPRRQPLILWLAAAAALAAVISVSVLTRGPVTSWQFSSGHKLRVGQWIEPTGGEALKIESDKTGEVQIDPGSRLRLVAASHDQEHFNLEHGTIRAFIWAPPGRFVVDTPSAKTIDLGCRYTLNVSKDGVGLLTVQTGWVAFESHGHESFIPEGAACVTRPALGPGTPYFTDASKELTMALAGFDTMSDPAAFHVVLASARSRDALTLWHLLTRTRGAQRAEVFDRFAALLPRPLGVSRDAILQGDPKAFDAAWNALELGNTDWWREWKRQW
jgi:hypothetical protein